MEITKETISAFNEMLYEDSELMEALGHDLAMRSLLDCLCSEWESTNLDQKLHAFHVFKRHGYSVENVIETFCARFQNSSKRDYIIQDMPHAVETLFNHAIACGDTYVSDGLKLHRPVEKVLHS
jgi:nicotinic acid mononucleotide adenylyltransferase